MTIYGSGNWNYSCQRDGVLYECKVEETREADVIKLDYSVCPIQALPPGWISADISPYERDRRVVELWIECDFPPRNGHGPLRLEQLEKLFIGGIHWKDLVKSGDWNPPPWAISSKILLRITKIVPRNALHQRST